MFLISNKERNTPPFTKMREEILRYQVSKGESGQEVGGGDDVWVCDPTGGVLEGRELNDDVMRI